MQPYRLTSVANQDVLEIWMYVARDNVEAADGLVDRFTETYERLVDNPRIGESVE